MQDLASLSTARRVYLGSAVLLFLNSFLPWYHVSAFGVSASEGGWHQFGAIAWIVLVGLLVVEGLRLAGILNLPESRAALLSSVVALVVVVLGAIFVLQRISDGSLGFAFFLGVILLIALGSTALTAFRESGGTAAVKREVDERRSPPVA